MPVTLTWEDVPVTAHVEPSGDPVFVLYDANTGNPVFRVDSNGSLTHAFGRPVEIRQISGFDVLTLV